MSTTPPQQPTMGDRFFNALAERAKQALAAAHHAPIEVAIGVVMALLGCWCVIDKGDGAIKLYMRGIMMCYPALLGVFALSILAHFGKIGAASRWLLSLVIVVASTAFTYFRLDPDLYLSEAWRWLTLCLGVTAGLALLPLILAQDTSRRTREFFWSFNANLLNHIGLSVSFLGALCIGLLFAMVAAKELLGVHFRSQTFGCVAICILVGLTPWQVITLLPKLSLELSPQAESVKQLGRIMCTYLFLPLMSIYLVILYLYQLRVMYGGMDAPKNMMSPLVLAAAGMLLVGMLLSDQLEPAEGKERGVFLKVVDRLPMCFLPLMPMSVWAVWIRIDQYGWTEFRYLRLMLILALSVIFILATIQYFRKRAQPLMGIIATFGVLSILATFGPLSAQAVSQRSQLERLRAHLTRDGLLDASGHITTHQAGELDTKDVSGKRVISHESVRTIEYLAEHFGAPAFSSLLPDDKLAELEARTHTHGLDEYDVLEVLSLKRPGKVTQPTFTKRLHIRNPEGVEFIPHAGMAHDLELYHTGYTQDITLTHAFMGSRYTTLYVSLEHNALRLKLGPNRHTVTHDLSALVTHFTEQVDAQDQHVNLLLAPSALRVYTFSQEGVAPITVSLSHLQLFREDEQGPWRVQSLGGVIVQGNMPAQEE